MSRKQNQKGITLISLVITVIILLILAAVAINLAVDSNGLFRKTGDAANKWNSSVAEEGQTLKDMLAIADEIAPPEVWYKIDGTTVYFSSSQKDEGYKLAKSRYDTYNGEFPEWSGYHSTIETVTFEDEVTPISTTYWFYCPKLMQINNIEYLNTSKVTDMRGMFTMCSVTTLDISGFDTSNVTNMYGMFAMCGATTLDLSSFDTSNVTDMGGMFLWCPSLTSLDLSSFDTSNVTVMGGMFLWCSSLAAIDVSGFDTNNVTDMTEMFEGCSSLTSLDMSRATFGKLTSSQNYANMFKDMANGATIKVKDEEAQTFIQSRLNDAGITATVEINTTP